MALRNIFLLSAGIVVTSVLPARFVIASDLMFGCWTRPACGKVCQLVCETKKLTATCYGCKCNQICIPAPSRAGCKHWTTCCGEGECSADCGSCCQACQVQPPACKFCWRDWCACGCAQPRTVKVLTKYQAEKEICWYHWEVVDAACCGCEICCGTACSVRGPKVHDDTIACHSAPSGLAASTGADHREGQPPAGRLCVYKSAPPESKTGDAFELNDDERSQLAAWMPKQLDKDTQTIAAINPESDNDAQQPVTAVQPAAASEPAGESALRSLGRLIRFGN